MLPCRLVVPVVCPRCGGGVVQEMNGEITTNTCLDCDYAWLHEFDDVLRDVAWRSPEPRGVRKFVTWIREWLGI